MLPVVDISGLSSTHLDERRYTLAFFASPDYATRIQPLVEISACDVPSELHAGRVLAEFVSEFDA